MSLSKADNLKLPELTPELFVLYTDSFVISDVILKLFIQAQIPTVR